ncbi:MAG: CbiQ family ECF transporter T component [Sulfurisoma sp.]|nr:CbiQ family ECF transporter T component [Sulfurisoma sp.]
MSLHPAVWIAGWGVGAMLLQSLELRWLAVLSAPTFLLVGRYAARDALRLVRRARWLLLTVAVLFVLATPGERLPGPVGAAGLTVDGVAIAAEHVLRLLLLLTTLAWLLRALRHDGLIAGLHCLLQPLGRLRDRIVVRLLLALEYVDNEQLARDWRAWLHAGGDEGTEKVRLAVVELRAMDRVALAVCGAVALLAAFPAVV